MRGRIVLLLGTAVAVLALLVVLSRRGAEPGPAGDESAVGGTAAVSERPGAADGAAGAAEASRAADAAGDEVAAKPGAEAPAPAAEASPAAAPPARSAAARAAAAEAEPEPADGAAPRVPIDRLLRLSTPPEASQGLEVDRNPHLREPAPEVAAGAGNALRMRMKSSEDQVGPTGQTAVRRNDASVGMGVSDSVELRGGVRVERTRDPGEDMEVNPGPNVGVEVRF